MGEPYLQAEYQQQQSQQADFKVGALERAEAGQLVASTVHCLVDGPAGPPAPCPAEHPGQTSVLPAERHELAQVQVSEK